MNDIYTNNELDKVTVGFGIAAVVAIIFNAALTIAKEMIPSLLAAMKSIAHHWIVHGIAVLAVFFVCGWILSRVASVASIRSKTLAISIFVATVVGAFAITGFYIYDFFK